jgi:phosphoheptose isomerase
MLEEHLDALFLALGQLDVRHVERLGRRLADLLAGDGRLLVAGNGGSAAHAQHLTAELVGRYRDPYRAPCSAIALHADTSSVTAVANDFGWDDVFARQICAHGRPGDALLAISTSGQSTNLLRATDAARDRSMHTWALTGAAPNPLFEHSDETISVGGSTATVQEVHQVVVHLLCQVVDDRLQSGAAR